MDHYCTSCGKPLPESGICPCGQNISSAGRRHIPPIKPLRQPAPPKEVSPSQEELEPHDEAALDEEYDTEDPSDEPEQEFCEEILDESDEISHSTPGWKTHKSLQSLRGISDVLTSYCKDPVDACRALAQDPQPSCSLSLMLISLILSAFGTLLLGTLYLEDFFFRWFCVGLVAPALAFGSSFLFSYVLALWERRLLYRDSINKLPRLNTSGLLSTVAVSSVFPSLLLAASAVLSPMDKSLQLFQFFALLILITWVMSLIFALFFVYRIRFRLFTLFFSILFIFLSLVTMRTLWVWFLTGEFHFALYLPLSLFFGGF